MKKILNSEKGQVILILILVMTVALAIGLSVIQRSLSDISTASKVEQSSRAFSAAEAGIEKAIQANSSILRFALDNNAVVEGVNKNDIPAAGQALEYPALSKEDMAQVWLADPTSTSTPIASSYNQPSFHLYFGTPSAPGKSVTDKPAIEVTVISWDGTKYVPTKGFFDSDSTRASTNGFMPVTCTNPEVRTNANTADSQFYCVIPVSGYPYSSPAYPVLVRLRLLYVSTSQPVAINPVDGASLPVQAKIFTATGTSGTTQRKVQVFRLDKVVPSFFDYAIFSAGEINK